jgi:hypothetical protein
MLTHKDKHAILALVSLQCSNSNTSDIASKCHESFSRQVSISRTSGDDIFERYLQATYEHSTLFIKRYACIKRTARAVVLSRTALHPPFPTKTM